MIPTDEQVRAIEPHEGNHVVVAAAGTGKTRTMVMKITAAIQSGISPWKITAITFTVAGARELRGRLAKQGIVLEFCGTLHAWAMGRMPQTGEIIADEDMDELIKLTMLKQIIRGVSLEEVRQALEAPADPPGNVGVAVRSVRHAIRSAGKTSFGMILRDALDAGIESLTVPMDLLIVDEAQDTSPIDAAIYEAFPAREKVLVGDPRQAIYGFRGCSPQFFNRKIRRGAKVSGLSQTFRCCAAICAAANRLFPDDTPMVAAATVPAGEGVVIMTVPNEHFEHAAILAKVKGWQEDHPGETIAVVTRYNHTVQRLAEYLAVAGVKVRVKVKDADRKVLVAALRALSEVTAETVEALRKELGARAEKMPELVAWVTQWKERQVIGGEYQLRDALVAIGVPVEAASAVTTRSMKTDAVMDALEAALASEEIDEEEAMAAVVVSTIHGVKGREFDRLVFARAIDTGDDEEECRLHYVAITRARAEVLVTVPEVVIDPWKGGIVPAKPNRWNAALL